MAAKKQTKKPTKHLAKKSPSKTTSGPKRRTGPGGKKPARRALTAKKRPMPPSRGKAKPRAKKVLRPIPENKEGLALSTMVARLAQDKKAEEVLVLDVRARGASVGYDYLVIASAGTDRQLSAVADAITDAAKSTGRRATSTERSPDWVLVNFDDVIVHLFTPEKRELYDLEGFWSDAPRLRM